MSSILGDWVFTIKTPIGSITAEYTFTESSGEILGSASGTGERVTLHDIAREPHAAGERVTWHQQITKPMRLNLTFDVVVAGDELHGHSRAGKLPRSKVQGSRQHTPPHHR
ncbi:hypothetical protein [Nesterenkonia alba]|uniref:hypothetical protein n=1 Tax=Nesterenkonia alba TaxID=515814 RepID=UPI0003B6C97A|nr:hypothetical protein [Nesterenkonia alba]